MAAEFVIRRVYNVGSTSLVAFGIVESGELHEGSVGRTAKGKRFTLVKIEKDGSRKHKAIEDEKVNIAVKNICFQDIKTGESLFFD